MKEGWKWRGSLTGINAAAQRRADTLTLSDSGPASSDDKPPANSDGSDPKLAQADRAESENKRAEVIARHRNELKQIGRAAPRSARYPNDNPPDATMAR